MDQDQRARKGDDYILSLNALNDLLIRSRKSLPSPALL
jgi:hypothetical protein